MTYRLHRLLHRNRARHPCRQVSCSRTTDSTPVQQIELAGTLRNRRASAYFDERPKRINHLSIERVEFLWPVENVLSDLAVCLEQNRWLGAEAS